MLVHKDVVRAPLYVVAPVFNPARFQARWAHYRDFAKRMVDAGAKLITIEAAFGERDHAIQEHAPDGDGHRYIRLRVGQDSELWLKENLQNLAIAHLPPDWRYMAAVDADMAFARPDIVDATLHALQRYDVVQMYSHIISAGPNHQPLTLQPSFAYQHVNGLRQPGVPSGEYSGALSLVGKKSSASNVWGTPGGAWAWRRSAFDGVGRFIDHAILGAADHYMALALIGDLESGLDPNFSAGYREPILNWQTCAEGTIKRNIGYVDGTIWHYWHGAQANRKYNTRAQILVRNKFDPARDLKRDWQGVIALTGNKPRLRDDVRAYFSQRNEDCVHVPDRESRLVGPKPAADWSTP